MEELPPSLIFEYIKHDYLNLQDENQRLRNALENERKKKQKELKRDEDVEEKYMQEILRKNEDLVRVKIK